MSASQAVDNPQPEALAERYRARLDDAVAELNAWVDSDPLSTAAAAGRLETLRQRLHGIAGSAASFGYLAVGELAQALVAQLRLLALLPPPALAEWQEVCSLVARFERLVQQGQDSEGLTAAGASLPANPSLAPIYVVEDDLELGAVIHERLAAHGFSVRLLADMPALEQAVEQDPPAAILIDIELGDGRLHGAEFAANSLVLQSQRIPQLFMSAHDDWEARLSALRAGGSGYITKPLDFHLLAETLDVLIGQDDDEPYRVLIIDDDVDLAELSATILSQAGLRVEVLNDPSELLQVLPDFNPEVVLLDLLMPQASGTEVAAVIRQRAPRDPIGIIILSGTANLSSRVESLLAGSDAYFPKPIDPDMLIAAVRGRARRARVQRMAMARDGLTGLNNHATVKMQLDELMALCERNQRPLSVAMIDVDHFKQVNDRYGHLVGDRVLANLGRLLRNGRRRMDVVGRYGGEEFIAVLPDTPLAAAQQVVERLRLSFQRQRNRGRDGEFSVTFSAGVALARADESVDQLIARADQALYGAKRGGRNRVELAPDAADAPA
ncbi:diguanylate cyclase [Pseudomarimonas arenosa]|uniref:diguanylate cyclase n=1 Tax=Pseudomarimonas arenosa TaxID=2774145 RepID=A0AAW3ZQ84_9GAMM|nr:diguanylate cyclase [Pseudomarimonas arenosa]MBD8527888.1 diguanylate cyclase [Pseudomarimonas arenosa]